eukprot:CAMPEP_0201103886 /NCGR_PEP_ID=MMETSP0812-20130820/33500_1 /ASSEMBLY_ACC=CAM_ASM_000668 /TAXON_ID=98059 /ORGANISM="Dinobryon sp., Strain UTEXLB2267" /LENGTH=37 /DNA_ID= /DNA_START= /DNA_END= /DNA_ORIENTATION=
MRGNAYVESCLGIGRHHVDDVIARCHDPGPQHGDIQT